LGLGGFSIARSDSGVYILDAVKIKPMPVIRTAIVLMMGAICSANAWKPGNYPTEPARMASMGLAVDNQSRNDVVAFWHAVYQASEGYEKRIKWDGNYEGSNGSVAPEFVADVERRLNYYRAMCGLNSNTKVSGNSTVLIDPTDEFKPARSTLKSVASQNAALMLIRNYNATTGKNPALSHYPPSNVVGWSPQAWNATAKGNFAFGLYGPSAITEYMIEQLNGGTAISSWNTLVGHRRWNLYPEATEFATGDQPGKSATVPPTNVFYVLQKPDELRSQQVSNFVAYPAPGYFPADINSRFWSLSRRDADFTAATVQMTDESGNSLAVNGLKRSNEYGDPAIIWQVDPVAATQSVYNDTTFKVSVSGIRGDGVPSSYSYSVTLINPNRLNGDPQPVGDSSLSVSGSATYSVSAPLEVEGLQVLISQKSSTPWLANAETKAKSKIIDRTSGSYAVVVKPNSFPSFGFLTGSRAFHLTFPNSYDLILRGIPDQIFELDRDILPKAKAKLTFQYRRGFMTKSSTLAVECTTNGGVTWQILGRTIQGISNTTYSPTILSASRSLPQSSGPIRVRFRYFTSGGSIYTQEASPKFPTGVFVDEISVKNCDWLKPVKEEFYAASSTQFAFSAGTVGTKLVAGSQWQLRVRSKLGGKWFPAGPAKIVTITP
jgi:hypothetical protein